MDLHKNRFSILLTTFKNFSFVWLAQGGISGQTPIGTLRGPSKNKLNFDAALNRAGIEDIFNSVISFLIGFMTVLGGLFFLFQIFIAAMNWINAGGNDKTVTEARLRIIQSLTGLAVIAAAYALIGLIGKLLGLELLNPLCSLTKVPTC